MASLSNPSLQIDLLTGSPTYKVTATVNVQLDPFETFLVNAGLPLQLQSKLWGNDGGLNGADDSLVSFTPQSVTRPGTYTFTANFARGTLNEDNSWFDDRDEVYSRFSLVSGSNLFPINVPSIASPDITGYF